MSFKPASPKYVLVLAGISMVLAGGLVYQFLENQQLLKENQGLKARVNETKVALFFIKSTATDLYLKPVIQKVKGREDPHLLALKALLAGPGSNGDLQGIFPAGSKVLGLSIQRGSAVLNLNRQATKLNVGAAGESLAIAALVNTLTKFPDVYRVKILVEGEEVESLAGHVDLTETFGYNGRVVITE